MGTSRVCVNDRRRHIYFPPLFNSDNSLSTWKESGFFCVCFVLFCVVVVFFVLVLLLASTQLLDTLPCFIRIRMRSARYLLWSNIIASTNQIVAVHLLRLDEQKTKTIRQRIQQL